MSWPWSELGLDGPASLEEVRRAYAQRVKEVHPEEDPEGFQRLHTAYQKARQEARRAGQAGTAHPPQASSAASARTQEGQMDFTDLLRKQEEKKEARPESRESRLDFDTLLEQERAGERSQTQPQEPELDFDTLLEQEQDGEEPQAQPQEPELDFDTLLEQEQAREEAEERTQEPSWDFQRLFHEEDARRQSGGGQDVSVSRALELVEMLFEEERSYQDWNRFLTCVVFFRVKWNPRFMAALAGAFQAEPVIDQRIRKAVCEAYGFEPGRVPQEHRAFYEAISGRKEQPEKQQKRRWHQRHPGLLILAIVVGIFFVTPAVIGLGIYLFELPDRQAAAKLGQYIEEDFGYPVEIQYAGQSQYLFYLPVQQKSFTAWPEGERDPSQGELGYGTDLGGELLTEALEAFFEKWGYAYELKLMNAQGGALSTGEMPSIYGVSTNFMGETEFLTALWEEMDRLSQEKWYTLWQPSYQIQMEAWNLPYFTYNSSDGPFPGAEILSYYEEKVPVELVTYLVKECGLRELDFGDRAFHLEDLGTVTLYEDTYVLMGGVEEATGQTERLYLYDGAYLVSVSASEFDPNMAHIDYMHLLMGNRIPAPGDDLPWPAVGIYRN